MKWWKNRIIDFVIHLNDVACNLNSIQFKKKLNWIQLYWFEVKFNWREMQWNWCIQCIENMFIIFVIYHYGVKKKTTLKKKSFCIPFKVNFKSKSILVEQDLLVDCKLVYPIVIGVHERSFKFVLFVILRLPKSYFFLALLDLSHDSCDPV
jgi:hypothetical protein